VIFANAEDLAERGLAHGDRVDVRAGEGRSLEGYTVVAHAIARGSLAAYYPEANRLVSLDDHDRASGTPSYKSVRVTLSASAGPAAMDAV
jgi:anaerobic selenocysteine-containing dehydrogenase